MILCTLQPYILIVEAIRALWSKEGISVDRSEDSIKGKSNNIYSYALNDQSFGDYFYMAQEKS